MHINSNMPMGWLGFWWLITLGLVIIALSYLLSAVRRRHSNRINHELAKQTLKRRHDNGEIDLKTYEQMLEEKYK